MRLTRRSFFRGAVSSVGVAAVAAPALRAATTDIGQGSPYDITDYHGYRISWTGWKPMIDSAMATGQWLAWPLRGWGIADFPDRQPYLYLSVPGFVGGPYAPGASFYIGSHYGRLMMADTDLTLAKSWVDEGLIYIKQLVEMHEHQRGTLDRYMLYTFHDGQREGGLG